MNDTEFDNQQWVKLVRKFYEETKFERKYPPSGVRVAVMMEVESFGEWLETNGYLTKEDEGKMKC